MAARKKAAAKRKKASRRELIDTGTNKLFVRRNERGTSFKKVVDAGRSIAADKRQKAKRKVPSGRATAVTVPDRTRRTPKPGFLEMVDPTLVATPGRRCWSRSLSNKTEDGRLRHPSFKGFRDDLLPQASGRRRKR